ncbi:uncharacterized protein LOC124543218 [Vanessa cardui]|uniref:uncharacterized protein LOC124543218 n=1 Tax=Vanessa cardui TaxID=171605 RepID=UPI001F13A70E|nr:uncharacterized protein LOC124543218 [Vanessa cardui]
MNYARWLLRYHDNLMKVEDTHPRLSEDLAAGYFGIKRTDNFFSRQPIDLVTEQTINADAGRTLTGISHSTNSIQARLRWTVNYAIRSGVCSFLLDQVGLSSEPDITNDLNANRIRKGQAQVTNFINGLNLRVNPFNTGLQESLSYNIWTGESALQEVANFVLSIKRTGDVLQKAISMKEKVDIAKASE